MEIKEIVKALLKNKDMYIGKDNSEYALLKNFDNILNDTDRRWYAYGDNADIFVCMKVFEFLSEQDFDFTEWFLVEEMSGIDDTVIYSFMDVNVIKAFDIHYFPDGNIGISYMPDTKTTMWADTINEAVDKGYNIQEYGDNYFKNYSISKKSNNLK